MPEELLEESELVLALLILLGGVSGAIALLAASLSKPEYWSAWLPFSVERLGLRWRDGRRGRTVAVRIYYPGEGRGPFPVILFSHGLGGSREESAYLGQYWAANGYVAVHLQHEGTDQSAWELFGARQSLRRVSQDPEQLVQRVRDLSFVLDQIEDMNRRHCCLAGLMDLSRVGVAGQDFGGLTALAAAGQMALRTPNETVLVDPRIRAAVVLDKTFVADDILEPLYQGRREVPVLSMNSSPVDGRRRGAAGPASVRPTPFSTAPRFRAPLRAFEPSGMRGVPGAGEPRDSSACVLMQHASLVFWNAFLKEDKQANAWLASGRFQASLKGLGSLQGPSGEMGLFDAPALAPYHSIPEMWCC